MFPLFLICLSKTLLDILIRKSTATSPKVFHTFTGMFLGIMLGPFHSIKLLCFILSATSCSNSHLFPSLTCFLLIRSSRVSFHESSISIQLLDQPILLYILPILVSLPHASVQIYSPTFVANRLYKSSYTLCLAFTPPPCTSFPCPILCCFLSSQYPTFS